MGAAVRTGSTFDARIVRALRPISTLRAHAQSSQLVLPAPPDRLGSPGRTRCRRPTESPAHHRPHPRARPPPAPQGPTLQFEPAPGSLCAPRSAAAPDYGAVLRGEQHASPLDARVHPKSAYRAGSCHEAEFRPFWEKVCAVVPNREEAELVLGMIRNGVDASAYLASFDGEFEWSGAKYPGFGEADSSHSAGRPDPAFFANYRLSDEHVEFANGEIDKLMSSGAVLSLGRYSELSDGVKADLVVSPLGVEPTKPRLILDARYLNKFFQSPAHSIRGNADVPSSSPTDAVAGHTDMKAAYSESQP